MRLFFVFEVKRAAIIEVARFGQHIFLALAELLQGDRAGSSTPSIVRTTTTMNACVQIYLRCACLGLGLYYC